MRAFIKLKFYELEEMIDARRMEIAEFRAKMDEENRVRVIGGRQKLRRFFPWLREFTEDDVEPSAAFSFLKEKLLHLENLTRTLGSSNAPVYVDDEMINLLTVKL